MSRVRIVRDDSGQCARDRGDQSRPARSRAASASLREDLAVPAAGRADRSAAAAQARRRRTRAREHFLAELNRAAKAPQDLLRGGARATRAVLLARQRARALQRRAARVHHDGRAHDHESRHPAESANSSPGTNRKRASHPSRRLAADVEQRLILHTVRHCRTQDEAARMLGVSTKTLYNKLRLYESQRRSSDGKAPAHDPRSPTAVDLTLSASARRTAISALVHRLNGGLNNVSLAFELASSKHPAGRDLPNSRQTLSRPRRSRASRACRDGAGVAGGSHSDARRKLDRAVRRRCCRHPSRTCASQRLGGRRAKAIGSMINEGSHPWRPLNRSLPGSLRSDSRQRPDRGGVVRRTGGPDWRVVLHGFER